MTLTASEKRRKSKELQLFLLDLKEIKATMITRPQLLIPAGG